MPTFQQFPLPDAGEGLTEAEIVAWHVAVGDTVTVNQTIVEIETAKSLVELPCPFAGTVTDLLAAEGDTVNVERDLPSLIERASSFMCPVADAILLRSRPRGSARGWSFVQSLRIAA